MKKKLGNLERECQQCGKIIHYSKADWRSGKIPDFPVCALCKKKVTRKETKPESMKAENPFAEVPGFKDDKDTTKKRRFGKEEA